MIKNLPLKTSSISQLKYSTAKKTVLNERRVRKALEKNILKVDNNVLTLLLAKAHQN